MPDAHSKTTNETPAIAPRKNEVKNGNTKSQPLDCVAREVANIAFGDDGVSEMHLRLMRIALEHYNVPQIISVPAESAARNGSHMAPGMSA